MSETGPIPPRVDTVPAAIVRSRTPSPGRPWAYLAGLLLAAGATFGAFWAWGHQARGAPITVRFSEGHGLKAGDAIRHRGIEVGRVRAIQLSATLDSVTVDCDLFRGAEGLAREGTQFWIVRPFVSLSGVRGLETLVEGRYLAVRPGNRRNRVAREFTGLDEQPVLGLQAEGALELVLEADHRQGLGHGSPVRFRGMKVGEVVAVNLASDAMTVELRILIAAEYRLLVRNNSVFWNDGGVDVRFGFRGLDVDVGTLETVARGGISFSTPDDAEDAAGTGRRFPLQPKEPRDWHDWKPNLIVGDPTSVPTRPLPTPLRAQFAMPSRLLGIPRTVRRDGWILAMDNDQILLTSRFVDGNEEGFPKGTLEFAGQRLPLADRPHQQHGQVLAIHVSDLPGHEPRWPWSRVRRAKGPEECLLVPGSGQPPLALAQHRIQPADDHWDLDAGLPVGPDWESALVVSRQDGCVVGLLSFQDEVVRVELIDPSKFIGTSSSPKR